MNHCLVRLFLKAMEPFPRANIYFSVPIRTEYTALTNNPMPLLSIGQGPEHIHKTTKETPLNK